MSVITFTTIRDKAVEQIKAAFANNKIHIAAHPGQFNEAEIRRLSNQTPAILTSFMGYDDSNKTIDFVSWVLYRWDNRDRLYNGALNIVSALIPVIRDLDCQWSIDIPSGIRAECLYTGTLDQISVTLWGVKWQWQIEEPRFEEGEGGIPVFDLDFFEGYDAAHHIGDSVAHDNINLEDNYGNTDDANP
jgi:hypothetical protein